MAKRSDKERPGVVMYFDLLKTLAKLSQAAQGRFLIACLEYGKELIEPTFDNFPPEDRIRLETLWEQMAPRIDRDAEGWKDGIIQRKYGGYCNAQRIKGEESMSFEDYRDWFNRREERVKETGLYKTSIGDTE